MNRLHLIYIYSLTGPSAPAAVRIASAPVDTKISPFLPEGCELLRKMAQNRILQETGKGSAASHKIHYCGLSTWFDAAGQHFFTDGDIRKVLTDAGIRRFKQPEYPSQKDWIACTPALALQALQQVRTSQPSTTGKTTKEKARKASNDKPGHKAADALDWAEANDLIRQLYEAGSYRNCMLMASGCYLGLRISDMLRLRWSDIYDKEVLTTREKKTGKLRTFRLNKSYRKIILACHKLLQIENDNQFVFANPLSPSGEPISRQRADQILKACKKKYNISSAETFSTHSLRKTFGRRVWLRECENGRGEQALLLLCEVFGHSSIQITKRYLGIRQEEILSVYDKLND